MSAPYGMLKFIPTGGINAKNLGSYMSFNKIHACGGSWMADQALISAGNFDEVTRLSKEAVGIMLGFEIGHVGINMPDQESSLELASELSGIFGMALKKGNSSNFAGSAIEVNNSIGLGEHGHIAIKTNNIYRAAAYLEANGTYVDMSTAKGPANAMVAVYLKGTFGGFAIHLLQK
jgi:2-dehydro-3-deoxyphosphogluconate aldolase/(4S)-4-hydroxy-2-oxoglutarate aldolase